jgi:hypothetical protein
MPISLIAVALRRARWRSLLALALLVGLGGGVAVAAVAGARRTDTALPRFVAHSEPEDVGVLFDNPTYRQKVVALPQVVAAGRVPYLFLSPTADGSDVGTLNAFALADPDTATRFDRPMVVAGRMPNPARFDEVAVNESAASRRHLHVGSQLPVWTYNAEQFLQSGNNGFDNPGVPKGPRYVLNVVGVIRFPSDISTVGQTTVNRDVIYDGQDNLYMTSAFLRRYASALGVPYDQVPGMEGTAIRLRRGPADIPAFTAAVRRVAGGHAQVQAGGGPSSGSDQTQRAIHVQALGMYLFAGLAALATFLIVGQALSRQVQIDARDHRTMWAMGMTRGQLVGLSMVRAGLVAVGGALLAVPVAVLLSPLTPVGLGRPAEIHPGFAADVAVLAIGASAIAVLIAARALLPALGTTSRKHLGLSPDRAVRPERPSRLGGAAGAGLPVPASVGVAMAFRNGGSGGVPARVAVGGAVAAVAALVAALTLGVSLGHLVDDPAAQGWTWDVLVGNPNTQNDQLAAMAPALRADPDIAAFAALVPVEGLSADSPVPVAQAKSGNGLLPAIALSDVSGSIPPPMLAGRRPLTDHEVALGTATLARMHRRVGETVDLSLGGRPLAYQVVGRVLMPSAGDVLTGHLDDGVLLTVGGLHRMSPDVPVTMFAVRYAPGVDPSAAFARLEHRFGRTILRYSPAADVENLNRVGSLPFLLAALVALLGVATLAHTLITAVRRRRHDMAVLKTIGFTRAQMFAMVTSQAGVFGAMALLIGVPIGVAAGRWAWHALATEIGAPQPAAVPLLGVVALAMATLVVAAVVAVLPARSASRLPAATLLRAE